MKTATIAKPAAKRCETVWEMIEHRKTMRVWEMLMMIEREDDTISNQEKVNLIIEAVEGARREERIAIAAAKTLENMGIY
jgi:hypothetical protein